MNKTNRKGNKVEKTQNKIQEERLSDKISRRKHKKTITNEIKCRKVDRKRPIENDKAESYFFREQKVKSCIENVVAGRSNDK